MAHSIKRIAYTEDTTFKDAVVIKTIYGDDNLVLPALTYYERFGNTQSSVQPIKPYTLGISRKKRETATLKIKAFRIIRVGALLEWWETIK